MEPALPIFSLPVFSTVNKKICVSQKIRSFSYHLYLNRYRIKRASKQKSNLHPYSLSFFSPFVSKNSPVAGVWKYDGALLEFIQTIARLCAKNI